MITTDDFFDREQVLWIRDYQGIHEVWVNPQPNQWLCVSIIPDNYPPVCVAGHAGDEASVAKIIQKTSVGREVTGEMLDDWLELDDDRCVVDQSEGAVE